MTLGRYKSIFVALLVTLCVACGGRVPSPLGWWDDFNPEVVMENVTEAEKNFMEWAEALLGADTATQQLAIGEFVEALAKDEVCYYIYTEWAGNYLYGLGSSVRNEYAFGQILRRIDADERFAEADRRFISRLLGILSHNRVGERAEELDMVDENGEFVKLSDFEGQRVLLLVVDTTCPSCIDMMQSVEHNNTVMRAAQYQELTLAVVAMGQRPESIAEFAKSNAERGWRTFCTGRGNLEEAYYDLDASPMLLLIGADGTVEVEMTRNVEAIGEILKENI